MKTSRKQELKGAFKAIVAIAILGLMIGIGVATTLMSDEGFFINGNAVLVEGDYTTWGHKWTLDLPGGLNAPDLSVFQIDDVNDVLSVLYEDDTGANIRRFGTFNLDDASIIFNSTAGVDYGGYDPWLGSVSGGDNEDIWRNIATSARTYLLFARANETDIEVWRAGSLVWTNNTAAEGVLYATSGGISNTGEWIIIGATMTGGSEHRLICYEGS